MSGFWKRVPVAVQVDQLRKTRHGKEWHCLYIQHTHLEEDTLQTFFDEHDMTTHRITITPEE